MINTWLESIKQVYIEYFAWLMSGKDISIRMLRLTWPVYVVVCLLCIYILIDTIKKERK